MPPELRKRKAPAAAPAAAPPAKKKGTAAKQTKGAAPADAPAAKVNGAAKVSVGSTIDLEGFGAEIETNDGKKTTLKALVDESKAGVVLFTYPKANTPGCTTQACSFRDAYTHITSTGLSIYGLSKDSPKANTGFKEKYKLPYPLLCDPAATLISAIGLKKAPSGTTRGIFVIDKSGKVLAAKPGSPGGTLEVVEKLIAAAPSAAEPEPAAKNGTNGTDAEKEDIAVADVAAQVADTAEKLDQPAEN